MSPRLVAHAVHALLALALTACPGGPHNPGSGDGGPSSWTPRDTPELLADVNPSDSSNPNFLTVVGNRTFFVADDGEHGGELWVTDGSAAGTVLVKDIRPGASGSYPHRLIAFGDKLLFVASTDVAYGAVWISDGTAAGTMEVKDITTTTAENISDFTVVGTQAFFSADDGVHGIELWVTDGTAEGTRLTTDVNPGDFDGDPKIAAGWNGRLYFYGYDETRYRQLWVTDGTPAGTQMLTPGDDYPGWVILDYRAIVYKDQLFFTYHSWEEGRELWVTDGTPAGTRLFKDLNTDYSSWPSDGWPTDYHLLGDRLVFFAHAPWDVSAGYKGVWVSDGTEAGTQFIKRVELYPTSNEMALLDGRLFFSGRGEGADLFTLWATDGTEAGTVEVSAAVTPDSNDFAPRSVVFGDLLVFHGRDADHGSELWVTDGTAAGTSMLADVYPGTSSSYVAYGGGLIARGGKAYYSAQIAEDDYHLVETDGTAAGTKVVAPEDATVTYSPLGMEGFSGLVSVPQPVLMGNMLLMRAGYTDTGHELYRM